MLGQPQIAGVMLLDMVAVHVAEVDVQPPPALPLQPVTIVDPNTPFEVWSEITFSGHLISLLSNMPWTIEYYAERMGGQVDRTLGTVPGTMPVIAPNTTSLSLGRNETKVRLNSTAVAPGLYKLTCVFKSDTSNYILGFVEGDMFQVAER